jgi:hypothetical protein
MANLYDIIVDVSGQTPEPVSKSNGEYKIKCLFHQEDTPSMLFNVYKNVYNCKGCGKKGGWYGLLKDLGYDIKTIWNMWEGERVGASDFIKSIKNPKPVTWHPIPTYLRPQKIVHPIKGNPIAIYPYFTRLGQLDHYVCRFMIDGKKTLSHYSYGERDGVVGWHWKSSNPKLIYNIHKVRYHHDLILFVEGEKCADTAERFLESIPALTTGGSDSVLNADWHDLEDRDDRSFILWPDNDAPGLKWLRDIKDKIRQLGYTSIYWVDCTDEVPKFDCADMNWQSSEHFKEYMKSRIKKA